MKDIFELACDANKLQWIFGSILEISANLFLENKL